VPRHQVHTLLARWVMPRAHPHCARSTRPRVESPTATHSPRPLLGVLIRILRGLFFAGSGDGGEGDGLAAAGGTVGLLVCEEDDAADEDEDGDEDEEEGSTAAYASTESLSTSQST